tara:strand:+ start:114 stop:221 length:108 start_codon:yes stop_codon:yes gene_type:complete
MNEKLSRIEREIAALEAIVNDASNPPQQDMQESFE